MGDDVETDAGWIAELRLKRLRALGWTGTLAEYVEAEQRRGRVPLEPDDKPEPERKPKRKHWLFGD